MSVAEEKKMDRLTSNVTWAVRQTNGRMTTGHVDILPTLAYLYSGKKVWILWDARDDEEQGKCEYTIAALTRKTGVCWCAQEEKETLFLHGWTGHAAFTFTAPETQSLLYDIYFLPLPLLSHLMEWWSSSGKKAKSDIE